MATYGLKYRADWQNTRKQFYRLDIYQRGFSGSAKEIKTLCGCALEIQGSQADVSAPIVKTQLRFSVIDAWDIPDTAAAKYGNWSEFYTPDATLYRVQLLEYDDGAWAAMWTGYITPDSWQEDLGYRTAITITARDNVGHLKDFQFDMSGNADGLVQIDDIIDRAMQKIEMAMDYTIARIGLGPESTQLITAGGTYLHEAYINAAALDGMDWYQVLERTLEATGMALRWVGKNKVEITYIRNLPNMGSPYPVPGYQTIEFYGGNLEFEPAVKQIEESVDFKFREDVSLDALGSFQYTPGSAYRCVVEGNGSSEGVAVHSAPLDVITETDDTVWNTGSEMFNPDSREPDSYLVNAEGSDGWKQYAMIPGNRDTDDPSTSFGFYTKTAAVRLSVNFAPFPVGIVDSGSDQGKVTALQYSLSSIKYQVRFEGDGITRYWSGSGWYSDHEYTITRDYDSENEYGTALEISLAECKAISAGRLIVTFSNIVYKRWDDSAIGVYARVQSILVGVISTRGVTEDKVTTINNQAYNVNVSRQPLFGALSKEVGFVSPGNYQGAIFHYPNGGSIPDQYPYMVRFNGQAASRAVPLPVIIHQQILCYRYGAARVLNGRCAPIDKAAWALPSLFRYKGVSYLLQGGTLDLFSGIMEGAVLHEFILFDDLWTGAPTYNGSTTYNTDTPGTGYSGGNAGGAQPAPYVLPTASASELGGVKVGTGLSIDQNGVLSANGGGTVAVTSHALSQDNISKIATISVNGVETDIYNDVAWGSENSTAKTVGLKVNGTTKNLLNGVPLATSSALGGIKVGYTQSGKNYPLLLDANNKAYVNVPWEATSIDGVSRKAPKLVIYSGYNERQQAPFAPYLQASHPAIGAVTGAEFVLMVMSPRRMRNTGTRVGKARKSWGAALGATGEGGLTFSDQVTLLDLRTYILQNYVSVYGQSTANMTYATYQSLTGATGFGHPNGTEAYYRKKIKRSRVFGIAVRWQNPEFSEMASGPLSDHTTEIQEGGKSYQRWIYSDVAPIRVFAEIANLDGVASHNGGVIGFQLLP